MHTNRSNRPSALSPRTGARFSAATARSLATALVDALTLQVLLSHPLLVVTSTLQVLALLLKSLVTGWPTLVLLLVLVVPTGTLLLLQSVPGRRPNYSTDLDIAWFDDLSSISTVNCRWLGLTGKACRVEHYT
jgi:hypothetical protein